MINYITLSNSDFERLDKEAEAMSSSNMCKFSPGINVLRFIPAIPEKNSSVIATIATHRIPVPGPDKKTLVFSCLRAHGNRPCPGCDLAAKLASSVDPADQAMKKEVVSQKRYYANVILRSNEAAGPRIIAFPASVYNELRAIFNRKRGGGNYSDPTPVGFDIEITVTGSGKETRYPSVEAGETRPLAGVQRADGTWDYDEKLAERWIMEQHPLDSLIRLTVPDELRQIWNDLVPRSRAVAPAPVGRQLQPQQPVVQQRAAVDAKFDDMSAGADGDDFPWES